MLDNILGVDLLKDLPSLDQRLRENWKTYMTSGKTSNNFRNVIACSWERCRKFKKIDAKVIQSNMEIGLRSLFGKYSNNISV